MNDFFPMYRFIFSTRSAGLNCGTLVDQPVPIPLAPFARTKGMIG